MSITLPSGFALFGRFFNEKRSDSTPVVEPILHDSGFEDFIFAVPPNSSLYKYSNHFPYFKEVVLDRETGFLQGYEEEKKI